jgi:bifunctional non-homologous end joining protein LigD
MHKKVHSSADWTKRTCRQRETFVVAGIAFNRGKFDGIYLARRENGELLYAGKVENGFDPRAEETFRKRAESLKNKHPTKSKSQRQSGSNRSYCRIPGAHRHRKIAAFLVQRHP